MQTFQPGAIALDEPHASSLRSKPTYVFDDTTIDSRPIQPLFGELTTTSSVLATETAGHLSASLLLRRHHLVRASPRDRPGLFLKEWVPALVESGLLSALRYSRTYTDGINRVARVLKEFGEPALD